MIDTINTTNTSNTTPIGAPWWRSTWPLHRREWTQLLVALVGVIAVMVLVGETLTNWAAPNKLIDLDVEIAENLAANRSESTIDLAHWGAFLADTPVKIGLSIILAGGALLRWRRWYEAALIGLTLIFEATAYVVSSLIVARPRPEVDRLLESPVATSFPSGHVAAATVYAVLAIIVFQRTPSLVARTIATLLALAVPLVVAWARMYQGMHFLSDVTAGIVLGLISIAVCLRVLNHCQPQTEATNAHA